MPEAGKQVPVLGFLKGDRRSANVKNNISDGLMETPEETPYSGNPVYIY